MGGGVFGPQPRDWSIKMNQKERRLAMGTALQSAAEGGAVSVVPDMEGAFASRKTRDCVEKLGSMGVGPHRHQRTLRLGSRRAPPDPRSAQREELNVYKRKNEIHIALMHSRQFLE